MSLDNSIPPSLPAALPSMGDAAVALADDGHSVFPCKPEGPKGVVKSPTIPKSEGGNGFHDASSDPAQVRTWWATYPTAAIGLPPGKSGYTVFDVDTKNDKPGLISLAKMAREHFGFADATEENVIALFEAAGARITRTPSSGYHIWIAGIVDADGALGGCGYPGIDIKCSKGYVCVPPSLANGKPYTGEVPLPWDVDVLSVPDRLKEHIERTKAAGTKGGDADTKTPVGELDTPARIALAIKRLQGEKPIAEGTPGTFNLVCRIRDTGVSEAMCLELMLENWNEHCDPPWPADKLAEKVRNAYRYGQNPPGIYGTSADGIEIAKTLAEEAARAEKDAADRAAAQAAAELDALVMAFADEADDEPDFGSGPDRDLKTDADEARKWHVYTDEPDFEELSWLVEGLIPARPVLGGICGFQHAGKTAVAASLVASIVTDQPDWGGGRIAPDISVVYVATEDPGSAAAQFHGVFKNLNTHWPKGRLILVNVEEGIDLNLASDRDKLEALVEQHVPKGKQVLVILDMFLDASGSADDMDHPQMKATMACLVKLSVKIKAPIVSTFHVGLNRRDDPSVPLGAPPIGAKLAFNLGVTQANWSDHDSDRLLTVHKMRGPRAKPITLKLTKTSGMTGRGKRFSATVFTPVTTEPQAARSEFLKPTLAIADIIRNDPLGRDGNGWTQADLIRDHGKTLDEAFSRTKAASPRSRQRDLERYAGMVEKTGGASIYGDDEIVSLGPDTHGKISATVDGKPLTSRLVVRRETHGARTVVRFDLVGCRAVDEAMETARLRNDGGTRNAELQERVKASYLKFEWVYGGNGKQLPHSAVADRIASKTGDNKSAVANALDYLSGIKGQGDKDVLPHTVPVGSGKRTRASVFHFQNMTALEPQLRATLDGAEPTAPDDPEPPPPRPRGKRKSRKPDPAPEAIEDVAPVDTDHGSDATTLANVAPVDIRPVPEPAPMNEHERLVATVLHCLTERCRDVAVPVDHFAVHVARLLPGVTARNLEEVSRDKRIKPHTSRSGIGAGTLEFEFNPSAKSAGAQPFQP